MNEDQTNDVQVSAFCADTSLHGYQYIPRYTQSAQSSSCIIYFGLGKGSTERKRFLSGIARMMGGGCLPMPEFFGPLLRSAFLVNIKSLPLQKCQCIELLTVF